MPDAGGVTPPPATGLGSPSGAPLDRIIRIIRRNIDVAVACLVLVPAAALAFSLAQQKEYSASAALLFRDPQFNTLIGSTAALNQSDPNRTAVTNLKLSSLESVAARAARALGVPGLGPGQVHAAVSISPQGESDVMAVTATSTDPRLAARIANTYAQQYIDFRREADRSQISNASALVQQRLDALGGERARGAEASELEKLARQLDILASLQTGNAELVQSALVPSSPSAPSIPRNVALGIFLGVLLAVALISLREQLDHRLKDVAEVVDVFDTPVLANIPQARTLARLSHADRLTGPEAESFVMLRTNLRYGASLRLYRDLGSVSILVTSPAAGDGKTMVAWNLAAAEARANASVLCLEADFRHPTIGESLGVTVTAGLDQVLAGWIEPEDAVVRVGDVDVLFAGGTPANAAYLLQSPRMHRVLAWAERSYERVIIDSSPPVAVADAIPLMDKVSGMIVVVRLGRTSRDTTAALRDQLETVDAPVLGLVLNASSSRAAGMTYPGRAALRPPPSITQPEAAATSGGHERRRPWGAKPVAAGEDRPVRDDE